MNADPGLKPSWKLGAFGKVALAVVWAVLIAATLLSCRGGSNPTPAETPEPLRRATSTPSQTVFVSSSTPTVLPNTPTSIPSHATSPTPSAVHPLPTPTPTAAPTGANTQSLEHTQYVLSALLDYKEHHLDVSQAITYVNRYDESLTDLLLVVEPNRQPDVFRLKHLSWADGQPVAGYTLEGARFWVPLREPLLPGAQVSLDLSFALDLPPEPGPLGYTPRQTNLGDWYPFVPPRHGASGWLVHEPGASGEHLVCDVADFQVEIQLADPRPDLTIAASGLAEVDENWRRYRLDVARSFAWSVSTEYVVITQIIGSITVTSYAFPEHRVAGEAALKTTADALALYTELFGPYPHAEMVVVEAAFPDGMEYDGLYFLGREYYAAYAGSPQGYLTAIAAHETAHQWWYGLVGNDQALEPWLDEALAIYSERLFYERLYPELVDWWWEFRVTRFNPIGLVDSTIYDHSGFRPYVDAVYLRGALFIEELRNLTGDAAFFAFLKDYVTHNTHAQATAEAFFSALAEHHPADLSALTRTYFASVE